jgi:DUF4097 and DUF4098 domain-containing protein YvlB
MTTQPRLALLLAVALLVPLPVQGQQVEETGDGFVATVNRTFAVDPGGTLDLQARNGDITVTGGDRSEVVVEETIRFDDASRSEVDDYLQDNPTRYEATGGTVRIRGPEDNGGGWDWWGGSGDDVQYRYVVEVPRRFSAQLRTSGGSLSVTNLEGTVEGRTAGGSVTTERVAGDVTVRTAGGSLTLREIEGRVQGETAGGSVTVGRVTGPLDVQTAGGSIRVTEAGADVTAETAGGSIEVDSVGGALDARTSGGDVVVRRVTGAVTAETAGGDIRLRDLDSEVSAETSGGDIEGEGLRGAVDARTSAGDVELRAVAAPVTAETSVGDIAVELTASSLSADPILRLTTSHGDIEVTLPADLQATIRAEVEGYGGGMGGDEIRSDVPLTREGGDGEPLRATGPMNGGGPAVELETSGGSIRVRTGGS